jgi:hypothetical protein
MNTLGGFMQRSLKRLTAKVTAALALAALTFMPIANAAASTIVVMPSDTNGWSTADTRTGGLVNFIKDESSPLPDGALKLTNDATTTSKAQYMHAADAVPLSNVTALSYQTKQVSGPVIAAASYQLVVDLNGAGTGGFATLVYEPYQNGTVTTGTWQTWDVDTGQFWATRDFTDGTCTTSNGAGGAPFYTS